VKTLDDRQFQIHVARVHLAECARRRQHWPSRDFYWSLFAWAQKARRQAAAMPREPQQAGLPLSGGT
jgi:hypothetical protein